MSGISSIGLLSVFVAGIVSFLSPCVLPLVPGYVSYVAGRTAISGAAGDAGSQRLPAVGLSLCFVVGFSTVFIVLGASATALGQLLIGYRYELNVAGGAVVILFGLFMMGAIRPMWVMRDLRFHTDLPGGRPLSAYLLGLAFGFGWITMHRAEPRSYPDRGRSLGDGRSGRGAARGQLVGIGHPFIARCPVHARAGHSAADHRQGGHGPADSGRWRHGVAMIGATCRPSRSGFWRISRC